VSAGPAPAIRDAWTLTARLLKHNIRSPDTIMTTLGMPVMMLLAFVFVLGGAMATGATRYIDFVTPVILLLCVASGVSYTAFRVNLDVSTGMFTRFRTMPIARSALLGGHIAASVIVNAISLAVVWAVALAIGLRPRADGAGWAATAVILVLVLLAFSVMGVAFGLAAKTNEGAGMFSYLLISLLFVSSGFAPTATMPAALRAFADHQPLTAIINALRDAQLGAGEASEVTVAAAWLGGIGVVFSVLAVIGDRRAAGRPL
jgi:ABC-2 type transport system permease protein